MTWYPHKTVAVVVEQLPLGDVLNSATLPALPRRFLMVEEIVQGQQVFNQPAGHLDPGETLFQAAVREALEETAWHVELSAFLGLYQYISPENNECYIRSCFIAKALHFDESRALDKDIVAAHWMTLDEIIARKSQLRSPVVLAVLEDYCKGQHFPLDVIKTL
ncbi:MAG: NUDIX hydrolase [Pseudohongiella sp.]|nr:NUDIX hydrolase [Pseudohongiella sp.]MDP2091884.1 NUDIX hydrolase [Pseudohongiella sp.]